MSSSDLQENINRGPNIDVHISSVSRFLALYWIRIDNVHEDRVRPGALGDTTFKAPELESLDDIVQIDNWDQVQDQELKDKIRRNEPLVRSTRWSLTCRDVPKVSTNLQRLRGSTARGR